LEITDLNLLYLKDSKLHVETLGRGVAWLDTGTDDSLLESSQFVQTIEKRQGLKIACIEEIAVLKNYISTEDFIQLAESAPASGYGIYLKKLARDYVKNPVR
jgi:glucose-1-phosphate thymidylyltransferase